MFEQDQMTGIGTSIDQYEVKYRGEHKAGKRDGKGILNLGQREYMGSWRQNKMHGRGQDIFPNGQRYMVYTDNGNRLEYITMEKDNAPTGGDGIGFVHINNQNDE